MIENFNYRENGSAGFQHSAFGEVLIESIKISSHTDGGNMSTVSLSKPAPDFSLEDTSGKTVSLSDFYGSKNVVLVFNRGFV